MFEIRNQKEGDFSDPNIPHYYLYEKPLSLHPKYPRLSGLDLLEVSCGQGAGIDWMSMYEYFLLLWSKTKNFSAHPELQKIEGCDRIALKLPRIQYNDAQKLSYPNQSYDIGNIRIFSKQS